MKWVLLFTLFTWTIMIAIGTSSAETFVVDDDGDTGYATINDALRQATNGDIILVYEGVYKERITVSRDPTILGNGSSNTTINGGDNGDVVTLQTTGIRFDGFEVIGKYKSIL